MLRILEESPDRLDEYCSIPIGYLVSERYPTGEPIEPYWKDYDLYDEEKPTALSRRFDLANWGILAAYHDTRRVGGAIVAWNTPGFDMLQNRTDLAVLLDIRVHPSLRGQGIGRMLFRAACDWSVARGCSELLVETQDVNSPACRFYEAMGCRLISFDPQGYGEDIREAKLIWQRALDGGTLAS